MKAYRKTEGKIPFIPNLSTRRRQMVNLVSVSPPGKRA